MKHLISSLRLQSKQKTKTNRSIFEDHRDFVAFNLCSRYRDGDAIGDMVGVIWDREDPLLPDGIRESLAEESPACSLYKERFVPTTLDRSDLASLLGTAEPSLAAGLAAVGQLSSVPVFVVSNLRVSLYYVALNPFRMIDSYEGDC